MALATKETPCRLVVIAFTSSATSKEWSTTMPECEEIQAIAAGEKFVAVATDARIIRFFTTLGTQTQVVALPGRVVCLAAYENKLAVVYHSSTVANKLSLMVISMLGLSLSNRSVEMPLSTDVKLEWLGFSDMGSIIIYDSTGRVTSYSMKKNLWFPICAMKTHVTGVSDKFFIISVSETAQKIRAVHCRGNSYPLTIPRPFVREIDYGLPFCYMESEKSNLEESLIRATTFDMMDSSKVILEKGLKLFTTALNSELEPRAFEIVELLDDKRLIELAAKYSSHKGRIHLANRLTKLLTEFDKRQQEKQTLLEIFEEEIEAVSEVYEMEPSKVAKENVQEISIAPKPMISQKRSNPFKKSGGFSKTSTPSASLDHLTRKSISTSLNDSKEPLNDTSNLSTQSVDTPRPGKLFKLIVHI